MEKTKTTSKYPSINKVINSLRTYIFISLTTYAYHPINKWSPQTYRSEKCINEYVQWLERHAKMIIIHNVADQTSELWSHRRHSVFFATGPLPDKGTNLIHEYGKWKAPDIIIFCQYKLAHHRHTHTHTHTYLHTTVLGINRCLYGISVGDESRPLNIEVIRHWCQISTSRSL